MNRRSFLGFACGGLIAAPAAMLVGECPSNGRLALVGEVGPEVASDVLPAFTYPATPYQPMVWPRFGIPFHVARKGFRKALADGDINADGDLAGHAHTEEPA